MNVWNQNELPPVVLDAIVDGLLADLDPHQAALRMARIKAHRATAQFGHDRCDGEPIDRMAQLRADDQRALRSYEQWSENNGV